jgi:hypothetical protein
MAQKKTNVFSPWGCPSPVHLRWHLRLLRHPLRAAAVQRCASADRISQSAHGRARMSKWRAVATSHMQKTALLSTFDIQMIIVPRQARDKHRETSKKRHAFATPVHIIMMNECTRRALDLRNRERGAYLLQLRSVERHLLYLSSSAAGALGSHPFCGCVCHRF